MAHRTLRRVMLSFAVVIVAVSALTLLGCPGGGGTTTQNVNTTIPMDATAANNGTTAVLNGQTFLGIPGSVLAQNAVPAAPGLANQTVSLGFSNISGATETFALTAPNLPAPGAQGTVRFASCTFTVTSTTNAAVLPVNTVITISNCTVAVSATGVPVGSTTGTGGTITLTLNGVSSTPVNTTVQIQSNGTLVVTNGTGTAVVTTTIVTGTSGG